MASISPERRNELIAWVRDMGENVGVFLGGTLCGHFLKYPEENFWDVLDKLKIEIDSIVGSVPALSPDATHCVLRQNVFDQWYLLKAIRMVYVNSFVPADPDEGLLAWSGSRWVPVSREGLPAGNVQISNFATEEAALATARSQGLVVIHPLLAEESGKGKSNDRTGR